MIDPGMQKTPRPKKSICVLPLLTGIGGPVSFQTRLVEGLKNLGYEVVDSPDNPRCSSLLVIGGPVRLTADLIRAHRRGIRIVQRLNGRNWLHRQGQGDYRYFLRSEFNNRVLELFRNHLADRIVYQSQFAEDWWNRTAGKLKKPSCVIYNSIDLKRFSPEGPHYLPDDRYRLLVVEGHLGGGYEQGLGNAVALVQQLNRRMDKPVELMVVGEVSEQLRTEWDKKAGLKIRWMGLVDRNLIPEIDRSAHLMFSADLNAACPNSVIEALGCGLPVVGFATGALPEVLGERGGKAVSYGGNPWRLEPADIPALADAAEEVLMNLPAYRAGARKQAEKEFSLDGMVERYLQALLD